MDLIQIKNYLKERKLSPLQDIATHFRAEVETIRPMLEIWVRKGKVKRHDNNIGCTKGCCQCDPAAIITYEWTGTARDNCS